MRFAIGLLFFLLASPIKIILLLFGLIVVGPFWVENYVNKQDTKSEDEVFSNILFWPFKN